MSEKKCRCIVTSSGDPESPDIELVSVCPEHGYDAQCRRDSRTLWEVYARLAAAMGVDVSEPFPAVDVFAEAEQRLRSGSVNSS